MEITYTKRGNTMQKMLTESEFNARVNDGLNESVNDFMQQMKHLFYDMMPRVEAKSVQLLYILYAIMTGIGLSLFAVFDRIVEYGKRFLTASIFIKNVIVANHLPTTASASEYVDDAVELAKKVASIVSNNVILAVYTFSIVLAVLFNIIRETQWDDKYTEAMNRVIDRVISHTGTLASNAQTMAVHLANVLRYGFDVSKATVQFLVLMGAFILAEGFATLVVKVRSAINTGKDWVGGKVSNLTNKYT